MISKVLQRLLLVIGVVALIVLLVEIVQSVAATTHGSTPARTVYVTAGSYQLVVNLYKDPANAGFALPFSIAPRQSVVGRLTYSVTSIPGKGVSATPVRASLTPDAHNPNDLQGAAEMTVQGQWDLQVVVTGPEGAGTANVLVTATAPPPVPTWFGWLIGFVPLIGVLIFLLVPRSWKRSADGSADAG